MGSRGLKRSLAFLLSTLTLVGGHFINRRWDRALLLFVVLALWSVGVYVLTVAQVWDTPTEGALQDAAVLFSLPWKIHLAGVAVLWIAGLAVTSIDARRSDISPPYRWTVSGVVGAVGLSMLSFGLLLVPLMPLLFVTVFIEYFADSSDLLPGSISISQRDRHFYHYVNLGRGSDAPREPGKLPSGDGYLRGQFIYEGRPAAGVTLTLGLNGKYETERLTTDDNGIFAVRLPRGEWTVNRLVTHEWVDRPTTDGFVIVSGTEPKLVAGRYNRYYWADREGVKVTATDQPGVPQLNLAIRSRIAVTWPRENAKRTPTTLADGAIAWDSYPGAETYLLRIDELKREGQTTTMHEVTTKLLAGATQFALAGLTAVPGEEEQEYRAAVTAFAKDGSFLSESQGRFDRLTFVLSDKQRLVRDEEQAALNKSLNADAVQELRANNRRIEAVEVLVQDGLFREAEKALEKIKGRVDPGKKTAVFGYLLAKRGRCPEANRLFAKAQSEAGRNCVPDYYRAACKR